MISFFDHFFLQRYWPFLEDILDGLGWLFVKEGMSESSVPSHPFPKHTTN